MEAFLVSTGIVALAEMGDKTQLLSLILAARFRRPWPIVLGIFIATVLNHALAGAVGAWLTTLAGPEVLRWTLGGSFIAMAAWMLVPDKPDDGYRSAGRWGVLGTTIVAFFLAEMGDKTQIATVALAAKYAALAAVVAGTTLGMMLANVPVVFLGDRLAKRIPLKLTRTVAAALFAVLGVVVLLPPAARAQAPSPYAIELPAWFTESFLDLREEVRDAAKDGKRVLLYFGQDGCPYCKTLIQTNFTQPRIVEKTRRHFVAIALNIWGDREVTTAEGKAVPEKEYARLMRVQFTPTVLFLDEKGGVVARLNGYYQPHRFEAALDYVSGRLERKQSFSDYMSAAVKEAASDRLHDEPFFLPPPHDLRRQPGAKPLAVIFETTYCVGCDEMHKEGFVRAEVRAELARFDVVRLAFGDSSEIVTPQGKRSRADAWARALNIVYTPSLVFFDSSGREVFRTEAYLRPFHLAGSLAYVSSGAYRKEPSFQRYLQARAEEMRRKGRPVDIWK